MSQLYIASGPEDTVITCTVGYNEYDFFKWRMKNTDL